MDKIRWTDEQIEVLKKMVSIYTCKTIAKRLKYPLSEIESKISELNLHANVKVNKWPKWKIDYLKKNIKTTSLQNIMETLDVNYYQLINKISELELEYSSKYWSPEEEQIIRELCPKIYIKYVADMLGRNQNAVAKKAKNMGVLYKTSQRVYTQEELDYIKDNWKIVSTSEMARKLKVSRIMIQNQANKMNLPPLGNNPYRKWTDEKIEELRELSKTKTSKELAEYFNCTQSSITSIASDNNIKLINPNVWTEEELNKLKELSKTKNIQEIAIILNKTPEAIRKMAKRKDISLIPTPIKRGKLWTKEECEKLKHLAIDEKKNVEEIAKSLERTQDAIIIKLNRMGLQAQVSKRSWTNEEDILLESLWGKESLESMVEKLHRSQSSIKNRAYMLNLGAYSQNLPGLTIIEISKILNVSSNIIFINWISLGLKVKEQKVSKNTSYKYVEIEDLLEFLGTNQNIWDSKNLQKGILGEEPEWLKEKRKKDQDPNFKLKEVNVIRQQLYLEQQNLLNFKEQQENEGSMKKQKKL